MYIAYKNNIDHTCFISLGSKVKSNDYLWKPKVTGPVQKWNKSQNHGRKQTEKCQSKHCQIEM